MGDTTSYEICVQGVLDEKWTNYFMPFSLNTNTYNTILRGKVHDQSELFGILLKIRDMGIKLVSVQVIDP